MNIYIASKVRHAARWLEVQTRLINSNSQDRIISTWIYEAGIGQSVSWPNLWTRCIDEVRQCDRLVLYWEDGDDLKGAIIEMGAALGAGKPVRIVLSEQPRIVTGLRTPPQINRAWFHPLVSLHETLDEAMFGRVS